MSIQTKTASAKKFFFEVLADSTKKFNVITKCGSYKVGYTNCEYDTIYNGLDISLNENSSIWYTEKEIINYVEV